MKFRCQNCATVISVTEKAAKVKGIGELSVFFCPVCEYPDQMDVLRKPDADSEPVRQYIEIDCWNCGEPNEVDCGYSRTG